MQRDLKTLNKRLVLQCIIEEQATNRASIAKQLNLSKPTVSEIVRQLLEDEWIIETGSGSSDASGGRKPVKLSFNRKRSYIIGIDIGGTYVTLGLLDLRGEVHAYREFPTQQHLKHDLFKEIERCIESMKGQLNISDDKIFGLGAGVPGMTDVEKGIVIDAPALGWKDFHLKEKLEETFDFPIYIDNDVNSIVLGEHWRGCAKDKTNFIYIAIGTGIGSGIILNGDLYRGSHYSAGEIGYLVTSREDVDKFTPVYKGYGHLESISSGSSISYRMSELVGRKVSAREAFALYQEGNEEAIEVINVAVDNLAVGIANYMSLFDPELIILGGGVSKSFSIIHDRLMQTIHQFTPQRCDIVQTTLGKTSGVVGAAALFLKEHDSLIII